MKEKTLSILLLLNLCAVLLLVFRLGLPHPESAIAQEPNQIATQVHIAAGPHGTLFIQKGDKIYLYALVPSDDRDLIKEWKNTKWKVIQVVSLQVP
jgi:hypothetical protein